MANTDKPDARTKGIDRYHDLNEKADPAQQLQAIYADWADTYDTDNDNKLGTVSQPETVAMFARHCTDKSSSIFDVGCGTGLVGMHLAKAGFTTFDGTDISLEMLTHAEKRGYRRLFPLAANEPLPVADNAYDATLCVGVFTHGHLGPEGIDELLRVTKSGGIICFTVNEGVWETQEFDKAVAELKSNSSLEVLESDKRAYMLNEGVEAWYIALRLKA